jgi:hypothetical protein
MALLLEILETNTQIGRSVSEIKKLGNPYSGKHNYIVPFELFEKMATNRRLLVQVRANCKYLLL